MGGGERERERRSKQQLRLKILLGKNDDENMLC